MNINKLSESIGSKETNNWKKKVEQDIWLNHTKR